MNLQAKLDELQERKGRAKQVVEQIEILSERLRECKREVRLTEQAQVVAQIVAQATQKELEFKISEIVSLALSSVFNDPYVFEVEFVLRRNKTEADLWLSKNSNRVRPLEATGGGVVDITCLALRIALWKLSSNKTDSVLILDEPTSHLSLDLQERASQMIKSLSKELGLQIIMISHVQDDIEAADKVIRVGIKKGVSYIS